MFRVRDARLPKPKPGCWKNRNWRARYNRIYMRIMREGPYGAEELRRQRGARMVRRLL